MPRTAEFDKSQVLDQAMEIFWRKGYEAASLQDLLSGMGLSKSSFYLAFGSKEELFLAALTRYQDILETEFSMELSQAPGALVFLQGYLEAIADNRRGEALKGCLLMNTASEFSQRNPAVAKATRQGVNRLTRLLAQAVQQAQAEGDVSAGADADQLGTFLLTTVSGLKTLAKAGTPRKRLRATVAAAIAYLRHC